MRSQEIDYLLESSDGYDLIKDKITLTCYMITYRGVLSNARYYQEESDFIDYLKWLGDWGDDISVTYKIGFDDNFSIEYSPIDGTLYPILGFKDSYIEPIYSNLSKLSKDTYRLYGEYENVLKKIKLDDFIDKL